MVPGIEVGEEAYVAAGQSSLATSPPHVVRGSGVRSPRRPEADPVERWK